MEIISQLKQQLNYQLDNFPLLEIQELVDIINNDSMIYFTGVGKSYNMAFHSADLIKSIGLKTFCLDPTKALHGDIGTVKDKDIVFLYSNSGNTAELLPLIENINQRKALTIGICCNPSSKFHQLCYKTIVLPFEEELSINDIKSIPTNSCFAHLTFANILTMFLIQKFNIQLENYKLNHPAGNIGKNLKFIKDVMIKEYPKVKIQSENSYCLKEIMLQMTKYKMGFCAFVDSENNLIGIFLDGDIRRLLLKNSNLNTISIDDINKNFCYETNQNKLISELNKKLKFIPILEEKKIIGIVKMED